MATSTINAYRKVLSGFVFDSPTSFGESFAQSRFRKKLQEPNAGIEESLSRKAWEEWIDFDNQLPSIRMPSGIWYRVARKLREELREPDFREIDFPSGSEFFSTRGRNSVESRLMRSRWSVTCDALERFTRVCYHHKALKRAVRHRYNRWFRKGNFDVTIRAADNFLYGKFKHLGKHVGLAVFGWKLQRVVTIVQGSRFHTVPKNNETRRPINIEPFGNIVVQRSIGLHLKSEIKRIFGIDLDTLPDVHKRRISNLENATIDLKNASDAISLELCEFLLPRRVIKHVREARSEMILGPDKNYYVVRKVSSMGNGFTFELMSLILNAVCKELDKAASVFGDDIIIDKRKALPLKLYLEEVGFIVNSDKSFVDGPFRESCGGNFHSREGYIESYDFVWPDTLADCAVLLNKAGVLSQYPSFLKLYQTLQRCTPRELCSGLPPEKAELQAWRGAAQHDRSLDTVFRTGFRGGCSVNGSLRRRVEKSLKAYHLDPKRALFFKGFASKSRLLSPTLSHLSPKHWAKYEMYLAAGRQTPDVVSGDHDVVPVLFVMVGARHFRVSSLTKS